MTVHLLIIDPQNDFCDLPPTDVGAPSLPVPGAHADMRRLAAFIRAQGKNIDRITFTLDSHQRFDIGHPPFWQQADGAEVTPFTPILAAQVRAGEFVPRESTALPRVLAYLDALEAGGRYTHMVWPVHCEIGRWGHGVHADVFAACADWQVQHQRATTHFFKGMNPWTEHYSAIAAEVPDPFDPATSTNTKLLQPLADARLLLIAGEAGSHCVRATVEHLIEYLPRLSPFFGPLSQMVLLTDCMSPVSGFETQQQDFLQAMQAQGVLLATSDSFTI